MSPYEHISRLTQPLSGYLRKRRSHSKPPYRQPSSPVSSDRYPLSKPAPQGSVSAFHAYPQGTIKIGDTLFVDGSPYISCAICQTVIKLADGETIQAYTGLKTKVWDGSLRSTKQRIIKSYRVLKGFWLRQWESSIGADGVEDRTVKVIPIVRLVPACLSCWQRQEDQRSQQERAHQRALDYYVTSGVGSEPKTKITFYGMDSPPVDEDPMKRRAK